MNRGYVITLLGAESSGKTTLAAQLAEALATADTRTTWVSEYLREWCVREGRTPRVDEQRAIAQEQAARIEAAARAYDLVVADTSALMIAVYSELVFGDLSLLDEAGAAQCSYDLTLLMALDLPWVPDGMMRDSPKVRGPVDATVRRELVRHGVAFSVIGGTGPARLQCALNAVAAARRPALDAAAPRWRHVCARCGDPDCERRVHLG